jgi:hypothetical protein
MIAFQNLTKLEYEMRSKIMLRGIRAGLILGIIFLSSCEKKKPAEYARSYDGERIAYYITGQKTEDGRQKAEGGTKNAEQRTQNVELKTEDRGRGTEDRELKSAGNGSTSSPSQEMPATQDVTLLFVHGQQSYWVKVKTLRRYKV